jgi:hypothetical protein
MIISRPSERPDLMGRVYEVDPAQLVLVAERGEAHVEEGLLDRVRGQGPGGGVGGPGLLVAAKAAKQIGA